MPPSTPSEPQGPKGRFPVWDLPVRLFHWALVALIATSFVTAQIGGNAMEIHKLSGFTILTLVLFRLLWGLVGGTHARFTDFVRGPRRVLNYALALRGAPPFHAGHNPLGGWMVLVLLASLLVQTGSGLFANDDIMTEGPLAKHVSNDVSDLLTEVHEINFVVLITLIGVHVAAALFYLVFKRENLIAPLVTGVKRAPPDAELAPARMGPLWLALVLIACCGGAVWLVVSR